VSVPHLVPYSTAKFAAVGFSEGLHAELRPVGIRVLTVVPGLMPGLSADVLALVDRLLPQADGGEQQVRPGWASRSSITDSPLTTLGERAADDLNQR
jgi:NAD(P)-dependent dehydrogenase (short-subunit alcohol dehydrogenase family)